MNIGIAITALALLAGCEKAGPKASGDVTSAESDLLAHIPQDADFAFGGNFMKLNELIQGPLGMILAQAESMAPGLKEWTTCFAGHKDLVMVGGVTASTMEMRFVMKGIEIEDLEKCANAAKFGVKVDSDKKFIEIKQDGAISQTLGYLVLADGAIYGKQNMGMAMMAKGTQLDRKTLEADIAGTTKHNLLGNAKVLALVEKTDRSKALWFAGNASSTPFGDKVGDLFGSIDLDGGLDIDITAVTKDAELAKQAVDGLDDARKASAILGPEVSDLVSEIKLSRDDARLRFQLSLSSKQLTSLMQLATKNALR